MYRYLIIFLIFAFPRILYSSAELSVYQNEKLTINHHEPVDWYWEKNLICSQRSACSFETLGVSIGVHFISLISQDSPDRLKRYRLQVVIKSPRVFLKKKDHIFNSSDIEMEKEKVHLRKTLLSPLSGLTILETEHSIRNTNVFSVNIFAPSLVQVRPQSAVLLAKKNIFESYFVGEGAFSVNKYKNENIIHVESGRFRHISLSNQAANFTYVLGEQVNIRASKHTDFVAIVKHEKNLQNYLIFANFGSVENLMIHDIDKGNLELKVPAYTQTILRFEEGRLINQASLHLIHSQEVAEVIIATESKLFSKVESENNLIELKPPLEWKPKLLGFRDEPNLDALFEEKKYLQHAVGSSSKNIQNSYKGVLVRGESYFHSGLYKLAKEDFEQAILNDPTQAQPHYYLGLMKLMEKDYEEAIVQFESLKSKSSNLHKVIAYYLGVADFALADYEPAFTHLAHSVNEDNVLINQSSQDLLQKIDDRITFRNKSLFLAYRDYRARNREGGSSEVVQISHDISQLLWSDPSSYGRWQMSFLTEQYLNPTYSDISRLSLKLKPLIALRFGEESLYTIGLSPILGMIAQGQDQQFLEIGHREKIIFRGLYGQPSLEVGYDLRLDSRKNASDFGWDYLLEQESDQRPRSHRRNALSFGINLFSDLNLYLQRYSYLFNEQNEPSQDYIDAVAALSYSYRLLARYQFSALVQLIDRQFQIQRTDSLLFVDLRISTQFYHRFSLVFGLIYKSRSSTDESKVFSKNHVLMGVGFNR